MKRIFAFALAASLVLMASCAKDDAPSGALRSGEVDFSIKTSLPRGIATYTSEQGGVNNLTGLYDLRYICEVWTREATPRLAYRGEQTTNDFGSDITFSARLLAMDYDFVFWADFVEPGNSADYLYITTNPLGLRDIELQGDYTISNEARDAYFAAEHIDLRYSDVSLGTVMLTRPFGKIRLVAIDDTSGTTLPYEPAAVRLIYTPNTFPGGFDALAGTVTSKTVDVSGELLGLVTQENVVAGGETYTGAYVFAFDYIFASPSMEAVALTINTYSDAAGTIQIGGKEISAIPVSRNRLTTVIGNLYTAEGEVMIRVDGEFEDEDVVSFVEVTGIDEVSAALALNASVKVTSQAGTGTVTIPLYTTPPSQITIDLSQGIADGQTVTIDGLTNDFQGTIIITAPDTNTGNITIYAPNAHVIIIGSYDEIYAETGDDTLIIGASSRIGKLNVNKGNVIVYGDVTEFGTIAEGSKIYWGAGTETRLREVLRKDGSYNHGVILTADISSTQLDANSGAIVNQDGFYIGRTKGFDTDGTFDYYAATPYDGYLFDGGGFTLGGQAFNNVMAIYAHDVTVKNLKVNQTSGMRPNGGISIYRSTNVVLDNVTVTNCGKEAGVIVNASTVTATGLKTSGNWYGGVIVTKGSAPAGGNKPEFTFDGSCSFGENVKVYIRTARTGTDYTVNVPAGWSATAAYVTPIQGGASEAGVVCTNVAANTQLFTALDFEAFQTTRDRYLPAAIEFFDTWEGTSNVVKFTVDSSSSIVNRPSNFQGRFYNTQGAGWIVQNVAENTKWEASAKIYVTESMVTDTATPFRVELWTTVSNPTAYPLMGVGNVDGDDKLTGEGAKWRIWSTDAETSAEGWIATENAPAVTPGWHTVAIVSDGNSVAYLVDGVKIGNAGTSATGSYCSRIMPEIYNFNSWNPETLVADPASFPDYQFDAYFGEITFKLK